MKHIEAPYRYSTTFSDMKVDGEPVVHAYRFFSDWFSDMVSAHPKSSVYRSFECTTAIGKFQVGGSFPLELTSNPKSTFFDADGNLTGDSIVSVALKEVSFSTIWVVSFRVGEGDISTPFEFKTDYPIQ